jgi:hypothetical protein
MMTMTAKAWVSLAAASFIATGPFGLFDLGASGRALPQSQVLESGFVSPLANVTPVRIRPTVTYRNQNRWVTMRAAPLSTGTANVQTLVAIQNMWGQPVNGVRVDVSYRPAGNASAPWTFYGAQTTGVRYLLTDVKTGTASWFQQNGVAPFNPFYLPNGSWELRYTAPGAVETRRTITIG